MGFRIQTDGEFNYIEQGNGHTILLLHGLFGALSNWGGVLEHFSNRFRVSIPLMPVYAGLPHCKSVDDLARFVESFVKTREYGKVSIVGNSLGGHVALLLALRRPEMVHTLTLTASSGLYEEGMGSGFIKRGDYAFIQERVAFTFFDPRTANRELVDEVFGIVNDRMAALRIITLARDAQRANLANDLHRIATPTCLIWGLNDNITPPNVAHEFFELLPMAELHFVDHCGHAPMMEQQDRFNSLLEQFLAKHPSSVLESFAAC